jgi:hypothetical protein
MASNSGYPLLLGSSPLGTVVPVVLRITQTTIENPVSNSTSIVACRFVAVETCLFVIVTS